LPPVYRADHDRAVIAARVQLGEQAFSTAWAQGRGMSLEQVLATRGPVTIPAPPSAGPFSTPVSKASPAGLTSREVEVLRLVAQGLTDAKIAERLVISYRTVTTHLSSIYTKLGVSSRSAATRFAVEHHLV
jgi:DNA-binding NarL/FixJ family response regulator